MRISSILLVVVTAVFLSTGCDRSYSKNELIVLCAAGLRVPMETLASRYTEKEGTKIRVQYGGSGTLLANLELSRADVYIAADETYAEKAVARGWVTETNPIAAMRAGIGVPRGNPESIRSLDDLLAPDRRVGIGNPEAASIGRYTKVALEEADVWKELQPAATFPTVNELAAALSIGALDAVIVWDSVAFTYPEVEWIAVPVLSDRPVSVTAGVSARTKNLETARDFCRFLAAEENAGIYAETGFDPISASREKATLRVPSSQP